jgi:hypothetical protein
MLFVDERINNNLDIFKCKIVYSLFKVVLSAKRLNKIINMDKIFNFDNK